MAHLNLSLFFAVTILSSLSRSSSSSSNNSQDFYPLQSFKAASDPFGLLFSWDPSTNPCSGSWLGVSCHGNRVTKLVLEGLNLGGKIQPLSLLPSLRLLSLKNNNLSDSLHLLNLSLWQPHLKLLYLSNNQFSGPFPESVILRHLRRLDLSRNLFSGNIPPNIGILLPRLLTLRLEKNMFSGEIPSSIGKIESLADLNVSYNRLTGEIPRSLSSFCNSSFIGNQGLYENSGKKMKKHWMVILLLAVAAVVVAALVLSGVAFLIVKRRRQGKENRGREDGNMGGIDKEENLVFFEGCREFVMEDLMRGSAEMLGKGAVGSTYRVVIEGNEGGGELVVKRVRKERLGKEKREWVEIERLLREIGMWRHPNVVSLLAYYSSEDELLLVYQYVPRGSLHHLLHGNRGPGRTPLDWMARFKIALGAAKGLSFLHDAAKFKLCHHHLTSSNILIGEDGNALISNFALHQLLTPPDITSNNTPKCDVFNFGVVLLEILTGRMRGDGEMDLARWVQMVVKEEWTSEVFDLELLRCKEIEDEMVALLQIALLCLGHDPKRRPKMKVVLKMIEDIKERGCRRGRGSLSPSLNDNSYGSSPGLSDDTATFNSS